MSRDVHPMVPVKVWADIDEGIVGMVKRLNEIPGVRTYGSCQGTIDEGGAEPYGPFVQISCIDSVTWKAVSQEFDVVWLGDWHGSAHPRPGQYEKALREICDTWKKGLGDWPNESPLQKAINERDSLYAIAAAALATRTSGAVEK